MAASDKTYRHQKTLDVVFGVSCVLMLASIIWMFADDYSREWKKEQRVFRDVKEAMSERFALAKLPDPADLLKADAEVAEAKAKVAKYQDRVDEIDRTLENRRAPLVEADNKARTIKADLDSRRSFYDIEVENNGPGTAKAKRYKDEIDDLQSKLSKAQADLDKIKNERESLIRERTEIRKPLDTAELKRKKLLDDFDLQAKSVDKDRWRFNDWFRSLPVLDAFNSPLRIHQIVLPDLPIDYNFKYVTRFDRCMTCHQGIDKPGYEKAELAGLKEDPTGNKLAEAGARIELLKMDQLKERLDWLAGKRQINEETREAIQDMANAYKESGPWLVHKKLATPLRILGTRLDALAKSPTPQKLRAVRQQMKSAQDVSVLKDEITSQQNYLRHLRDLVKQFGSVKKVELSDSRITEFCAHRRLDLFVDANSPHPAEKFGCTSCHGGQGSATGFFFASHTPNDSKAEERWRDDHGWKANHDWEFPMKPRRFREAECLKCHHQVTDLIREGNKIEAPKLVRGYNLVRENGCFGCHEIAGIKGGRSVGPDLRLEPNPPLESLPAAEQAKARADAENMPGTMRKVGPSLYRLSEKTHIDWVKKWIRAPRDFRPTTKMPHFYGLSNNDQHKDLKDSTQYDFADAEIDAIGFYLFHESAGYLDNADSSRRGDYYNFADKARRAFADRLKNMRKPAEQSEEERKEADRLRAQIKQILRFQELLELGPPTDAKKRDEWRKNELKEMEGIEAQLGLLGMVNDLLNSEALSEQDKRELGELQRRLGQGGKPKSLAEKYKESVGSAKIAENKDMLKQQGRRLFTEKGCLACHSHAGVTKEGKGLIPDPSDPTNQSKDTEKSFKIDREKYYHDQPTFGPNLSMLKEKLGTDNADNPDESKRRWLIQWIMDPTFHSPRTLMPVTHLTFDEAAAVAAWLLDQDVQETEPGWDKMPVPQAKPDALETLARLTLDKAMSSDDVDDILKGKFKRLHDLSLDERELAGMLMQGKESKGNALKWYVGKKAIGRLGCFGCHNIPGFDYAKSIGTPLNDWGKKDPERIAFEDIKRYVEDKYNVVDDLNDVRRWPVKAKDGKEPFEKFFAEALAHHQREGFLYQKLKEPRSYDYTRERPWDDRLRMPQFKFARTKRRPNESDTAFAARREKEEAEAREAVMTFILGLVAEPIPEKYVNQPGPDRMAEVRGRQVIDKYNCSACHQLRPGIYDFKMSSELRRLLEDGFQGDEQTYKRDHYFPVHNAWKSPVPPRGDRVVMRGMYVDSGDLPGIVLTEALAYNDAQNQRKEIRAYALVPLKDKNTGRMLVKNIKKVEQAAPWGGQFSELIAQYLMELGQKEFDPTSTNGEPNARGSGPPSLLREGEKVQPNWLFGFLKNPIKLRPLARLRMPRFNMSDEEAMALVNYFAAVDRVANPGIGLTFPYAAVREQDEGYLAERNREYIEWIKQAVKDADAALKKAEEDDKKNSTDETKKAVAEAKQKLGALKHALTARQKEKDAYATDGFRLLANRNLCLSCHQVANLEPSQKMGGPPLQLAEDRLRPDWLRRWLANPDRLIYKSVMPQNFSRELTQFQDLFVGPSLDQATAARDVLMNFRKVADMPANRNLARQIQTGGE
jgi:mono/diheme cytochrome c family protein